MPIITNRRALITGIASLLAAPAIVRASSLMPVKAWSDGVALYAVDHPVSRAVAGAQIYAGDLLRIQDGKFYPYRGFYSDGMIGVASHQVAQGQDMADSWTHIYETEIPVAR